jgi:hypothetical protein
MDVKLGKKKREGGSERERTISQIAKDEEEENFLEATKRLKMEKKGKTE